LSAHKLRQKRKGLTERGKTEKKKRGWIWEGKKNQSSRRWKELTWGPYFKEELRYEKKGIKKEGIRKGIEGLAEGGEGGTDLRI